MILRSTLFHRVTVVGVGFMGGSVGLAIKKNKLAKEVIGLSHKQSTIVQAIKSGAIDSGETDMQKALRNADLVILCSPVESIIKLLSTINPYLKRGCIVTDIGSSKSAIVEAAEEVLTHPGQFVGSHPLVGSEKKGVAFSEDNLFNGAVCLMTPTAKTSEVVKKKVKQFWTTMGANVEFVSPKEHDEALSYVSHLPHLVAYSLMESVPQNFLKFAPQSLRDVTRIASSSPEMWNDICISNSKNILKSLDHLVNILSELRRAIVAKDEKGLIHHFNIAKEKRDAIQDKS